ncbi:MAG: DNA polymerase III subunit gamma/tau [Burkholderiaceae bacterium]|nr:DNA polymerase III subunit gamma/tau [Burkholderiaceae bacterium]
MPYIVLARKYRPRNFTEMVGQEHVVQALTNALTQQRLHHAYLFTGTRGVGKTTVSRILAKSLNCQGPDGQGGITATPCGVCQACRDIDSGRFVDYTELDAASNRGVDEVQSLLEQAVYKPVQGRFKVFMIDEVHMLTNTAFNAMLKTLEEPPEYLKFVLATTDPQKVPVTVLSRCLQFNLRPMAPETVLDHLTKVLAFENVPAQPQALRLLARAARGSMRDALSLTDQAIAFGSGQLEEPTVRLMLGSVDRSYVFRLIESIALGDGKTVVETAEVLRLHGLSAASTLEDMSAVLQRMAVLQAVPQMAASVDASDPDAVEIARLAALLPADETQLLYSICLHGRGELGLAPDEYAALTMVLLRPLAFKPATTTTEKKTLIRSDTASAPALPAAASTPFAPAPVSAPLPASPPVVAAPSVAPVLPPVEPDLKQKEPPAHVPSELDAINVIAKNLAVAEPLVCVESPSTVPEPGPAAASTHEGDVWHAAVQALIASEAITALVRELALQSQLLARDGGHWLLRVERELLNQPSTRERLRVALEAAGYAQKISIEIGPVTDNPARRNAAAEQERQRMAQSIVENDPFVQAMLRDYDAKIVPGSIQPL